MINKIIIITILVFYIFFIKYNVYYESFDNEYDYEYDYEYEYELEQTVNNQIKVNILVYKSPLYIHLIQNKQDYNKEVYKDYYTEIFKNINDNIFKKDLFVINDVEYMNGDIDLEKDFLNESYGSDNMIINDTIIKGKFRKNIFDSNFKNYIPYYIKYLNNFVLNGTIGDEDLYWSDFNDRYTEKYINIVVFGNYNQIIDKNSIYTYYKDEDGKDTITPKSIYITSYNPSYQNVAMRIGKSFGLDLNYEDGEIVLSDDDNIIIDKLTTNDSLEYPSRYIDTKYLLD